MIPHSPPVIATAKSALEQVNPIARPMQREIKSAAQSPQQQARLFSFCPIRNVAREAEPAKRSGYSFAKEVDGCSSQERWNAAVNSTDTVREQTMTSRGRWLV